MCTGWHAGDLPGAERTRVGVRLDSQLERAVAVAGWDLWGPWLSERAWGTVREDYSANGDAWTYFPHDHARSRAYRWSEDGLAGICDRQQRLCEYFRGDNGAGLGASHQTGWTGLVAHLLASRGLLAGPARERFRALLSDA